MNYYLLALCVGERERSYRDFQIIEAMNKEKALEIYNDLNCCDYYYCEVLARVIEVDKVEPELDQINIKKLLDLCFRGYIKGSTE